MPPMMPDVTSDFHVNLTFFLGGLLKKTIDASLAFPSHQPPSNAGHGRATVTGVGRSHSSRKEEGCGVDSTA